jgi:hypothetical protein
MNADIIKNLAAATMLQAAKDYFHWKATPEKRAVILKDLRSEWMDFFTDGMSIAVADKLEKHPEEIKARLKNREVKA